MGDFVFVSVSLCHFCAHGGQNRVSGPLDLESQVIVSRLWVLGIEPEPPSQPQ